MSIEPEDVVVTYVVEPGMPARAGRAYVIHDLTHARRPWVLLGTVLLLAFGMWLLTDDDFYRNGGIALAVLVVVVLLVLPPLTARRIAAQFTVGSTLSAAVRADSLWMSGPDGTSDVAFSAFRSIERRGEFVFFQLRASRLRGIAPGALLPDDSFAEVARRVAAR